LVRPKINFETVKIFSAQISAIFAPRSTTQSPQIHQQITIKKNTIFQNHPQKRPQNSQNLEAQPPDFFRQIRARKTSPRQE
jgi:hypothetical protein